MKNLKTNWTSPKTNILTAANDLRNCLASGFKARLIRVFNEDCQYPILKDKDELSKDFREYEFQMGTIRTKAEILADTQMSNFEKKLSLEFHAMFGTQDAVNKYYQTGKLSEGNFLGVGKSHLVRVSDMIQYLQRSTKKADHNRALIWSHYTDQTDDRHFYDSFRLKSAQYRTPKVFKRKLFAVEMLGENTEYVETLNVQVLVNLIKIIVTPLKYIPRRSILQMPTYKVVTYRVGDVTNGFSVEFHVPKKFSFK